jgi:Acetyl esterase (deacetylase)
MQTRNRKLVALPATLAVFTLLPGLPAQDARNTNTPNTDTKYSMPEYKTVAAWEARRAQLRKQILHAAGLLPMPEKTPLNPRYYGKLDRDGYTIEKVALETMPGYYLGGNLYRPKGKTGKLPAIVRPHGHWTYGRLENQPLGSVPLQCINLARQGYVVFAYDMVGWNDTAQTPHDFDGPAERLWSFGPLGLQLWNSIRVVDFLESLPDVDPSKIGATGASGGGTQTFLLTAVDDRIAYSAPVNMVSFIMQGGSPCENAPGLRIGMSNVEIAAMMAPKPMLLVSATGDWTRNLPREEFPAIRQIYELYDKASNVEAVQFDAPHNYNKDSREAVYTFFGKHVLGNSGKISERNAHMEKLQDMLVFHGRSLPENALSYDRLFEQWKEMSRKQFAQIRDLALLRERLRLAFAAAWPEKVTLAGGALQREGAGDRVPAAWTPGQGTPVLYLHPEGIAAARNSKEVAALLAAKRPVLLIDAFQTGSAKASRDRSHRHFLTFNVSDDAARVQDVLTALRYLESTGAGQIEVAGEGTGLLWGLFAAAIAPEKVHLQKLPSFRGADADYIDHFFVPHIQRAGGLEAALRLTEGRRPPVK